MNSKHKRCPSIKLSDSLIYNPSAQKARTTLTKAKQPSNGFYFPFNFIDIESVDVSIEGEENGTPLNFRIIGPKKANKKDEYKSVCSGGSSAATTCSSKVLQEALANAIRIKKSMRTRSGIISPENFNRAQPNMSLSSKSKILGKENVTNIKFQPALKEQQILDAQWGKLLNKTNNIKQTFGEMNSPSQSKQITIKPFCSPRPVSKAFNIRSKSPDFSNPNLMYAPISSPISKPLPDKKPQIAKRVIEIVTTKPKNTERSFSPLIQRNGNNDFPMKIDPKPFYETNHVKIENQIE